jgi:hypothetical protein
VTAVAFRRNVGSAAEASAHGSGMYLSPGLPLPSVPRDLATNGKVCHQPAESQVVKVHESRHHRSYLLCKNNASISPSCSTILRETFLEPLDVIWKAAALNSAANGIVITDRHGRILWANPVSQPSPAIQRTRSWARLPVSSVRETMTDPSMKTFGLGFSQWRFGRARSIIGEKTQACTPKK